MHFGESFDCFQFDKDQVFNDQVNAEGTADRYTLIRNFQVLLALESDTSKGQFVTHACFIRPLQKSRTEVPVNLDGRTDYQFRDLVFFLCELCALCASAFIHTNPSRSWRRRKS